MTLCYDDASKCNQSKRILSGLDNELERVKEDVMTTVKQAHKTLQRLEEIALNPDPLSASDYIRLCILRLKNKKPNQVGRNVLNTSRIY